MPSFIAIVTLYALGFLLSILLPEWFSFFNTFLGSFGSRVQNLSQLEFTGFIFLNNFKSAILVIITGFLFGIAPLIYSFFNGAIFGYVVHSTYVATGSLQTTFFAFAPHAIFEIPATLLAMSLGLWIGFQLVHDYFVFYEKHRSMRSLGAVCLALGTLGISLSMAAMHLGFSNQLATMIFVFLSALPFFIVNSMDETLRKKHAHTLHHALKQATSIFVKIILPLLALGAIIEGLVFATA